MSRETDGFYKRWFLMSCLEWFVYFCVSLLFHTLVVVLLLWAQRVKMKPKGTIVTWITVPSTGSVSSGGSSVSTGNSGDVERQRRVDKLVVKRVGQASGKDTDILSKAASSVRIGVGNDRAAKVIRGAPGKIGTAGVGSGGGVGVGTSVPGLKASNDTNGATGLISELDGNFPFVWYLQQIQARITGNWGRVGLTQGRVQVYFRIMRNGTIDGVRIESPSGSSSFDHTAFLAVLRSSPLPRLPDGFDGDSLGVRFWFTYLGS